MKKIFFSLAAALFAATSFAQGIVLEHTFYNSVTASSILRYDAQVIQLNYKDFDDCLYIEEESTNCIKWWDETYTEHVVNLPVVQNVTYSVSCAAQNIFAADNRMCFVVSKRTRVPLNDPDCEGCTYSNWSSLVVDEFGTVLLEIPSIYYMPYITYLFGEYKLIAYTFDETHETITSIYSLPGAGKTATDNEIVQSAPRRNLKYIQDAQVLVEENDRTYNMTGARVK